MTKLWTLTLVAAMATAASAQPASVFGKPLPAPDLAKHTITVRVIAGSVTKPVAGIAVTLEGDGKPRTAKTDAAGRATFTVAAGAKVRASVKTTDAKAPATSELIDVPDDAGVRVVLSTVALPPDPPTVVGDHTPDAPMPMPTVDAKCHSGSQSPDHDPQIGKPMPAFVGKHLDGAKFDLASLRGHAVLVDFAASWNCDYTKPELVTLDARAAAKDLAVVVVMSNADAKDVVACTGAHPAYQIMLDAPPQDVSIGPLTTSLKITALPESILVDKAGVARAHYINKHDWSTDGAKACAATMAR